VDDVTGNAIEGVEIKFYDTGIWEVIQTTYTAADGSYVISQLGSGNYYIEVAGYDVGYSFESEWIALGHSAGDLVLNFSLEDSGDHSIIAGRTLDAGGSPLAGVLLTFYRQSGSVWNYAGQVTTDAVGQFRSWHLSAGNYKLAYTLGQVGGWYGGSGMESATVIQVAAGETVSGIDLTVATAGSIAGRITNGAGVGIPNSWIGLYESTDASAELVFGYTDANGYFELRGLLAGSYKLKGSNQAEGYMPAWVGGDNLVDALIINLASDESVVGQNLVLHAGAVIFGRLVAARDGQPLGGQEVKLLGLQSS
jgi:5-hydroxyisourate hydrolase-like protein (transthyretin family)